MTSEELREIRRRLGLSQTQFAAQLGITSNSLARQERGVLGISEPVAKLARLLLQLADKERKRPKANKRKGPRELPLSRA
jgi:DNA-binding transcriptional regulator YiaG